MWCVYARIRVYIHKKTPIYRFFVMCRLMLYVLIYVMFLLCIIFIVIVGAPVERYFCLENKIYLFCYYLSSSSYVHTSLYGFGIMENVIESRFHVNFHHIISLTYVYVLLKNTRKNEIVKCFLLTSFSV